MNQYKGPQPMDGPDVSSEIALEPVQALNQRDEGDCADKKKPFHSGQFHG